MDLLGFHDFTLTRQLVKKQKGIALYVIERFLFAIWCITPTLHYLTHWAFKF